MPPPVAGVFARFRRQTDSVTPAGPDENSAKGLVKWPVAASVAGVLLLGAWIAFEVRGSAAQAGLLSRAAAGMSFSLKRGAASNIAFPESGPYDERLGYTGIPKFVERLGKQGFSIERQAEMTPELQSFIARGGYAVYREKNQAGLSILDRDGTALYRKVYPEAAYATFADVPSLVVNTLLFIEDRELLDPRFPAKNPAVDWDRFTIAAASRVIGLEGTGTVRGGASTLATQIEKFRHSPGGRTGSSEEKLRQMATASVRAYMGGPDSMASRKRVVVDYLNSTPLGSRAGFGEINGISDGLKVWYGTDFAEANRVLTRKNQSKTDIARAGLVYKQVLSLLIAQRRPAFYLRTDLSELDRVANSYVALLQQDGKLSPENARAARATKLRVSKSAPVLAQPSFTDRKAIDDIRTDLLTTLDVPGLYSLDRLDLSVRSTIDRSAQAGVVSALKKIGTPLGAKELGFTGINLLEDEVDPSKVIYSVVLYERGEEHHSVRVHADSLNGPFDINSSAKLILGSTAKLRTVATYLNIIYDLHQKYAQLSSKDLRAAADTESDPITTWATSYLIATGDRSLKAMLDAAMQRRYSASPWEGFYTGGGLHRFANFRKEDNDSTPTVEAALRHSINLPMVRLMRDVVRYYAASEQGATGDLEAAQRNAYLKRFADNEGRVFLSRFYADYKGLPRTDQFALAASRAKQTPRSQAAVYLALNPNASLASLKIFLQGRLNELPDDGIIARLHKVQDGYSTNDIGWLTGIDPLELWLVNYLNDNSTSDRKSMFAASAEVRQDAYEWLFKANKGRQDTRIRVLREEDAFKRVLEEWRGQGYPFNHMVPSLASALGSSGDRPDALARLMGIILNEGIDLPVATVEGVTFAQATPFETELKYAPPRRPVRVFAPEVAGVLRRALLGVVAEGTAIRAHNTFRDADGRVIPVGGKTGTGDNQFKTFDANGNVTASRSVDRTATFAFFVGDKIFGTITAYVPGPDSANYTFTSSIAVQLLKTIAPEVRGVMQKDVEPNVIARGGGAEPVVATEPVRLKKVTAP